MFMMNPNMGTFCLLITYIPFTVLSFSGYFSLMTAKESFCS